MTPDFKQRILDTTRGTQTGAIIACAMDKERDAIPRYVGKAIVTSDGYVMCSFVDRHGETHSGAFVGSVEDLDNNLLRLKNHMHLSNSQYNELTAIVTGWISQDYRS